MMREGMDQATPSRAYSGRRSWEDRETPSRPDSTPDGTLLGQSRNRKKLSTPVPAAAAGKTSVDIDQASDVDESEESVLKNQEAGPSVSRSVFGSESAAGNEKGLPTAD